MTLITTFIIDHVTHGIDNNLTADFLPMQDVVHGAMLLSASSLYINRPSFSKLNQESNVRA